MKLRKTMGLALLLAAPVHAQEGPPPPAVETSAVEVRQLRPAVTVTGQVRSRAAVDLAAAVAGRLAWVAEPGTHVRAGERVARLDTDELELQKLEQQARVKRGEISHQQLAREAERLRALGTAVSRVQLDQAESARDLAGADLEIARALLRQTEERLSRAEIRAPFAGVVSERTRRAGEEVARGETVGRLLDPETLEIRLFLPLRHVRAIRAGDRVRVDVGGAARNAPVRAIVPAGDPRTQSFEVLVDLPAERAAGAAPAGSVVRVDLPLGEPQALMAVPRDALIIRRDGMAVFRVNGENKAERVAVTPGAADGDWVAIEGPLAAGDQVVVRGGETLQDGRVVKVVGVRTMWTGGRGRSERASP